jgi:hypothetical protein
LRHQTQYTPTPADARRASLRCLWAAGLLTGPTKRPASCTRPARRLAHGDARCGSALGRQPTHVSRMDGSQTSTSPQLSSINRVFMRPISGWLTDRSRHPAENNR